MSDSKWGDFVSGFKAIAPILLSLIPFGILVGIVPLKWGFNELQTLGMSTLIYAGASQLDVVELVRQNAPVLIVILTALVINVRFAMYSASIAPYFQKYNLPTRGFLGYLLVDPVYAASILEFTDEESDSSTWWYYLGAAIPIWFVWQGSTAVGVFLGVNVPRDLGLDFAIPLMFLALLFPALKSRSTWFAAGSAALVAVLAAGLPLNLGFLLAVSVGIATGLVSPDAGEEATT